MTHGEITIEIKSDTLSEAISIRDFLVTFNQVLMPECRHPLWTERAATSRGSAGDCTRMSRLQPSLFGASVCTVSAVNRGP